MPTVNSWNNEVLAANVTLNGGTVSIGTDATSGAINIGTGAAARTVTVGNNVGASSVVVDCGTGALNLGANAIARTTTLGCTTGAGVLALKYGTGDFTLASATGTVMSALDTGEITYPLQPSFAAKRSADVLNVTGNGAAYTIICDTEITDISGDYAAGTGIFTAPVDGQYFFSGAVYITGTTAVNQVYLQIQSSVAANRQIHYTQRAPSAWAIGVTISAIVSMDAADTVVLVAAANGEAGNTDDVGAAGTFFTGCLLS